jgi:hypothetical protein
MFKPGDQGYSYDVRVREFDIINGYMELLQPLLGDLLHVVVGQLVIGL